LPFTTAADLPDDWITLREYKTICKVLAAKHDRSLEMWRSRVLYTEQSWGQWERVSSSSIPHRDAYDATAALCNRMQILSAPNLRSADIDVAAQAWNVYRRQLLIMIRRALLSGVGWVDSLINLKTLFEDPVDGYPRLVNYFKAALQNDVLIEYPLLHVDVLFYDISVSYATGSLEFDTNAYDKEWHQTTSRRLGEDLITLAIRVTDAYILKLNNPTINATTVWRTGSYRHDINLRFGECVLNDETNRTRGEKNYDKWVTAIAQLDAEFELGEFSDPMNFTCDRIAAIQLIPYENAHFQGGHSSQQAQTETLLPPVQPRTQQHYIQHYSQQGQGARARRDARRAAARQDDLDDIYE
jgi:hypothetical protein